MEIENLDHLGLVAALVDEIGLVELTDELLAPHPLNHISPGQVVKAMILNGLGFVSAPLYLFSEFFDGKPVEHLLGAGITAAHLNDDRLGRVLDQLFECGTTLFFLKVAMQAVIRFGVSVSQCHLDSTSFTLDGEYPSVSGSKTALETGEPQTIEICRGYSRDHRPELKQFLVNLICSADGGIPVWFKVGSGNETDSQTFAGLMRAFAEQWQTPALMVADAAFYSEPNLQQVGSLPWLSRVPQTLKAAQTWIDSTLDSPTEMLCEVEGYRLWEQRQRYGGVDQRWILVESPHRTQSQDWLKPLEKQEKGLQRSLRQLWSQVFACKPDAMDALMRFQDSLTGYTLTQVALVSVAAKRPPGRPKRARPSNSPALGYQWQATLERTAEYEAQCQQRHRRFILATNVLDEDAYPAERLLREYKAQQHVERGFCFLKDPLFFTSSVFVKKPQRVEALALVMALTLLVYSLGQRKLKAQLAQADDTVLDQKQRPTRNPTFRWILQKFQAIHLVSIASSQQVSNLSEERSKIIRLMGFPACRYYLLN
ncbi:IS1634 family transposase [filamentous cyanobacterium CCT1]|nr:IS1634 family transposase [filamentous cyanobacterium CCT1]PSN81594.1 IS1634 family transposase [filamentous cyanobacterium CCP4]